MRRRDTSKERLGRRSLVSQNGAAVRQEPGARPEPKAGATGALRLANEAYRAWALMFNALTGADLSELGESPAMALPFFRSARGLAKSGRNGDVGWWQGTVVVPRRRARHNVAGELIKIVFQIGPAVSG